MHVKSYNGLEMSIRWVSCGEEGDGTNGSE